MNRGKREQGSGREAETPLHPSTPSLLRPLISVLLVALSAVWLYHRALGFAYFNDDPTGHFAWMEGQALWQFFAGSADYGYYRPVVFAVLRFSELLFSNATFPHNPVADHALLLLLHAANAAMVWLLARRLSGRDAFAWAASLVFAFVPFSYEAVAYVASLTHPLLVFWTLAALLLYGWGLAKDDGRQTAADRRRQTTDDGRQTTDHSPLITDHWPLLTVLLLMTLGLLTHENGLFILPALVGVDWVMRPGSSLRERARRLWPFAVPPALFAVLWLLIPKSSEQGLNSLADIGRNMVPFLQTLVFPLLPVVRLGSGDIGLLVLSALIVVAVFGLLAWRVGAWRLWAFALGWFALSVLPALLFLGPAYVYGSPRLSYLPSIGVALLWGLPVLWMSDRRRPTADRRPQADTRSEPVTHTSSFSSPQTRISYFVSRIFSAVGGRWSAVSIALTMVYIAALLLPPLPFIRCQLDFYDETSRFARGMAAAGTAAPAGRDVVFINAPFFFSSTAARPEGCPSPYPWTPIGGVLIPPYAQARDFVRFNGGPDRPVAGVTYPGYNPGWRTFGPEIDGAGLRAHATADAAYVFDLMSGAFVDLSVAWQPGAGEVADPAATFGDALALVEAELRQEPKRLIVALEWRVMGESAAPLATFVHVYDAGGALVAQSDGPPGSGLAPQTLWAAGDGLADKRVIDVPALPPGAYRVAVGVYNVTDGARLAAVSAGAPLADNVYKIGVLER